MINCKIELKIRWTRHSVLSVAGTDNANRNNDDIILFLLLKTQNYTFL